MDEISSDYADLKQENEDLRARIAELEAEVAELQREIEIAKAERDQWRGVAEKFETALSAAASNVLALQCDAARWRECERLAYPASPMVDKWWRITVFGDTFADAIDASIAARGDG